MANGGGEALEEGRAVDKLHRSDMRRVEGDVFGFEGKAAEESAPATEGDGVELCLGPGFYQASFFEKCVPLEPLVVVMKEGEDGFSGSGDDRGDDSVRHKVSLANPEDS